MERQKSCYFWFTDEALWHRRWSSDVLEVGAKTHLWLLAGQGIVPNSVWLIHPPAPGLWLGRIFIHHCESYPHLILKGLEPPHSSISDFFIMKFQSAHTKEQSIVTLMFQLGKPIHGKAKWCTRGHAPGQCQRQAQVLHVLHSFPASLIKPNSNKMKQRFIPGKMRFGAASTQDQPWNHCGSVETLELMTSAKLIHFCITKFQEIIKSFLIIETETSRREEPESLGQIHLNPSPGLAKICLMNKYTL